MKPKYFIIILAGIFLIPAVQPVSGQTFNMQDIFAGKTEFGLKYMHPNFKTDLTKFSATTGMYEFYFKRNIKPGLSIVGSIPFTRYSEKTDFPGSVIFETSASGLGNIFLGLMYKKDFSDTKSLSSTFGINLPTAKDEVSFIGYFANYYDMHKSLGDYTIVYTNFAFREIRSEGPFYGFEIGPQIWIFTGDGSGEGELFSRYGLTAGYRFSKVAVSGELLGNAIISEGNIDFTDRFHHLVNFGVQLVNYRIQPGLFIQLPLNKDLKDVMDYVIGSRLGFALN